MSGQSSPKEIQEQKNTPPRLELFSDAFFAIIITIMILELHPPKGDEMKDLYPLLPLFFSYCLSFFYLILDWHNHHQSLRTMTRPTGKIMWANSHLLFWISLIPFSTAWFAHNIGERVPTVIYATVFLLVATAFFILQRVIIAEEGSHALLAKAIGNDMKGKLTLVGHVAAVGIAFIFPWASITLIVLISLFWIFPDTRVEKRLKKKA